MQQTPETLSEAGYQGLLADLRFLRDLYRDTTSSKPRGKRRAPWVDTVVPKNQRPRCGAKCRSRGGAPCRARVVWDHEHDRPRNHRCRMHGGLSTGPRTAEGRARCAEAVRRRWARWREARASVKSTVNNTEAETVANTGRAA